MSTSSESLQTTMIARHALNEFHRMEDSIRASHDYRTSRVIMPLDMLPMERRKELRLLWGEIGERVRRIIEIETSSELGPLPDSEPEPGKLADTEPEHRIQEQESWAVILDRIREIRGEVAPD